MKYPEDGFRAIYQKFFMVEDEALVEEELKDYPGADIANAFLGYCFYDVDDGLSFIALAAVRVSESDKEIYQNYAESLMTASMVRLEDHELTVLDDSDGSLAQRFADWIEVPFWNDASDEVKETRDMEYLDASRDQYLIDVIDVMFVRDDLEPELCPVRITGTESFFFYGVLVLEPEQDFGYHKGDTIFFMTDQIETGRIICYIGFDYLPGYTREELEDGEVFREALETYSYDPAKMNLVQIWKILSDSWVWIPLKDNAKEGKPLPEPAFIDLNDGEELLLPVFLRETDMEDELYRAYPRVCVPFMEVLALAQKVQDQIHGIVVGPYLEKFFLETDMFDSLEMMVKILENAGGIVTVAE